MLRNSIAVVSGVVLSVVLNIVGSRLVWLLIIGNVESSGNKDAIIRVMLWRHFFVVPVASIVVGAIVASIVARSAWWFGGVATLPLFIYWFIQGADGPYIVLFVIYIGMAFVAAYGVSRFKRKIAPSANVQQTLEPNAP